MTDKNNLQNLQKPYWDEELELIVLQDNEAKIHAQKSLNHFLQTHQVVKSNYNHNNIFMTINNLFHKFTLATIFVGIITILAISTVTAQAFAPDELKPSNIVSNLFTANKQPDKDPQTQLAPNSILAKTDPSLSPDDNNYVVNLEGCDLAVKVPKKVGDVEIEIKKYAQLKPAPITKIQLLAPAFSNLLEEEKNVENEQFYLKSSLLCGEKVSDDMGDLTNKNGKTEVFDKVPISYNTVNLSIDDLKKETGWFVTAVDIQNIKKTIITGQYFGNNLSPYVKTTQTYAFNYKNKNYLLSFDTKIESKPEYSSDAEKKDAELNGIKKLDKIENAPFIRTSDIQIQFNSFVTNYFTEATDLPDFYKKDCGDLFSISFSDELKNQARVISSPNNGVAGQPIALGLGLTKNGWEEVSIVISCYPNKGEKGLEDAKRDTAYILEADDKDRMSAKNLPEFISEDIKKTIEGDIYQTKRDYHQNYIFSLKNKSVVVIHIRKPSETLIAENQIKIDYKK